MSTFISLGNALQKFDRFLDIISQCDNLLSRPVIAQIGNNEIKKLPKHWQIHDFVPMEDFTLYINKSSNILIHGGAGSIINCLEANKKPIVMSRLKKLNEHLDDHQVEFVNAMSDKNYIHQITNKDSLIRILKAEDDNFSLMHDKNMAIREIDSALKKIEKKII